ncbi:MAG TPA: hypothetical protein VGI39_04830 [Polyangiaceae bacterium]|jgi:hypothetical protein
MIIGYDEQNQPLFAPLTEAEEELLRKLLFFRREPYIDVDYLRPVPGDEQEAAELLVERGFARWGSVHACGWAFLWITSRGSAYASERLRSTG